LGTKGAGFFLGRRRNIQGTGRKIGERGGSGILSKLKSERGSGTHRPEGSRVGKDYDPAFPGLGRIGISMEHVRRSLWGRTQHSSRFLGMSIIESVGQELLLMKNVRGKVGNRTLEMERGVKEDGKSKSR